MKATILLSAMMLMFSSAVYADDISEERAKEIAMEFLNGGSAAMTRSASAAQMKLARVVQTEEGNSPELYIFNRGNGEGWVVVAGDDCTRSTVLAYSLTGSYEYKKASEAARTVIDKYAEGISQLRRSGSRATVRSSSAITRAGNIIVEPLLKTKWNQTPPYNNMCPKDSDAVDAFNIAAMGYAHLEYSTKKGYGGRCPTGCGITTLAQIMNYWQWPKQGSGSHTHIWDGLNLSTDFWQSNYDWGNMLDTYTDDYSETQANAVAKLMADIGCATDARYQPQETASTSIDCYLSLIKHFGYSATAQRYTVLPYDGSGGEFLEPYPKNDKESILKIELDAKQPVFIEIDVPKGLGRDQHFVVCDGYDDADFFHLNYGWGGDADGFYQTSSTYGDYDVFNIAIRGIRPPEAKEEIDNIWYEAVGDSAIVSCPEGSKKYVGDLTIHPTVNIAGKDRVVNDIYRYVFHKSEDITAIIIPGGVKKITEEAFYECPNLKRVTLEDGVEEIGTHSFMNCQNLTDLVQRSSHIKYIGERAFCSCNLDLFDFRESKGYIVDEYAFYQNFNLGYVAGLENAAELRNSAFSSAKLRGDFTVSPTCKYGNAAVSGEFDHIILPADASDYNIDGVGRTWCYIVEEGNPNYSSCVGDLYNKAGTDMLKFCLHKENRDHMVPCGVKNLTYHISGGLWILPSTIRELEGINFGSGGDYITVICLATTPPYLTSGIIKDGDYNPRGRQKLIVPNGCKALYEQADGWCEFEIITDEELYTSDKYFYQIVDSKYAELIGRNGNESFSGKASIPATVNLGGINCIVGSLNSAAFRGDRQVVDVTLPEGITWIKAESFRDCKNLATVTLGNAVGDIDEQAFADCPVLKKVTIPSKELEVIGNEAFINSGIEELVIQGEGNGVLTIYDKAFYDCHKLRKVTFEDVNSYLWIKEKAFANTAIEGDLTFNKLHQIEPEAFMNSQIGSVSFPSTSFSLSNEAFKECQQLYAINVAGGNQYYYSQDGIMYYKSSNGAYGVDNAITIALCPPMQKIDNTIVERSHVIIPDRVEMIIPNVFYSNLQSITIPASVKYIVSNAFMDCINLKEVVDYATIPQQTPIWNNQFFWEGIFKGDNPAVLHVPKGCISAYAAAEGWSMFTDIREIDGTDVKTAKFSPQITNSPVYDLQGRQVRQPQNGLYIQNGKKIIYKK